MRRRAGVTATLGTMGMKREDIPSLARNAMHDACMLTNPRRFTLQEVEALYLEAF